MSPKEGEYKPVFRLVPRDEPLPCAKCRGGCCKQENGLEPHSVDLTPAEALDLPESKIVDDPRRPGQTIYGLPHVNGRCVYLTDDDRCAVYDRRPQFCRKYDCRPHFAYKPRDAFFQERPELTNFLRREYMLPTQGES